MSTVQKIRRCGVIAKKLGMSRIYNQVGENISVTLLQLDSCEVVSLKTEKSNGYDAVQLGFGSIKPVNLSKPLKGHFAKNKVEPKAKLVEFRVSSDALLKVGDKISADHYVLGQYVDISGITIGKGFAGGMKRHNFGGLEATHGVSISHRSHGSTGQCQDPGKVFKGKKMAGQMGNKRSTIQNLEVMYIDQEQGVIAVNGSVPGSKGSIVIINDAVKKACPIAAPFPAGLLVSKNDNKKDKAVDSSKDNKDSAATGKDVASDADSGSTEKGE